MVYAPCPACCMRWVGAVASPECPVCGGEARIAINRRVALAEGLSAWPDWERVYHHTVPEGEAVALGARIVSRGVWLGLARVARDTADKPVEARCEALRARVRVWREWRVLGEGVPAPEACGCFAALPGDDALFAGLCAAHVRPARRSKVTALGAGPRLSASGHSSPLAMAVDPLDLDARAGKRFLDDRRVWNAADALDLAVTGLANSTRCEAPGFDLVGAAA